MPAGRPDRRVIALGLGIPAAILVAIVLVAVLGGRDGDGTDADEAATTTTAPDAVDPAWDRAVAEAFEPLVEVLPSYARAVDEWSNGDRTGADLAALLDDVEPVVADVARSAEAVPAHRRDDLAQPLVADAADLYVQAVAAHRAALDAGGEDLSRQWDHLGRRLRILGDRTFDRARERTSAPVDPGDGVELRLPAEVPDFDRLELAVGPPLEPTDTNVADAVPRLRADDRPSQALAAWEEAVDGFDAPGAADVEAARGDVDALAALARRLVAAAEALRDEPVPEGDRGRADRLALGWLVLADAARAAQLAELGGAGGDVAEQLLRLARGPSFSAP
ncbi:MAG: hypothetical protein ACLGIC_07600 [Acidimicrobiia bacterium]